MQLAVEEATADDLSVERLVSVHRALLESSATPAIAGRVRDEQNWIGGNNFNPCGAEYVPPPPEEVGALVEDLVSFSNADTLPPVVHSALAHAQFELIHPFADGNGRTGRALVQIILRRRGLAPSRVPPISVVLAADKERYVHGLTLFREGEVDGWIETFAVAAARSADLASAYLRAVRALQDEWRRRLEESVRPRSDAAAWQLIDVLPGYPVLTSPVAVAITRRSKPVVDNAIAQLVQAQVLTPLTEGRRNRSWEADGLLDLLSQLEQGVPPAPSGPAGVPHS
jgi:Fic family protein